MRKWDLDGVLDPEATMFGEFVLKASSAGTERQPLQCHMRQLHTAFMAMCPCATMLTTLL